MKQFAMLLVAGIAAFTLSACGEERPKEPAENDNSVVQPAAAPAEHEAKTMEEHEAKPMNDNAAQPENNAADQQQNNNQY